MKAATLEVNSRAKLLLKSEGLYPAHFRLVRRRVRLQPRIRCLGDLTGISASASAAADSHSRRLSRQARSRLPGSLDALLEAYVSPPTAEQQQPARRELIPLAGGLPNSSFFPFSSFEVALRDGHRVSVDAEEQVSCVSVYRPLSENSHSLLL